MEYAEGGPLRKLYGNKALWPGPEQVNLVGQRRRAVGTDTGRLQHPSLKSPVVCC